MYRLIIISALATITFGGPSRLLPDSRVEGGSDTTIEKHPWQCSQEFNGAYDCGCVLFAWDRCLTSAQCTYNQDPTTLTVRCGTTIAEEGGIVINVLSYNQHPNFTYWRKEYDLSILHLEEAVSPSPQTGLINLALATDNYPIDQPLTLTGWGDTRPTYPSIFQEATLNLVQPCEYQTLETFVNETIICAIAPEKGACLGDLGNPLLYKKILVGIVSRTMGCGDPTSPGVYADVTFMRNWIDTDLVA